MAVYRLDLSRGSIFSVEALLLGGFSIIFCLATWAMPNVNAWIYPASQAAFTLAFVCNHPHFLSSYVLLYGDYRKQLFKNWRFFWAGVLAPTFLAAGLLKGLFTADREILAHIITLMFFLVGWHYVKQVFGCVMVTSALRRQYYSPFERRVLLSNLFATWFISWLTSQVRYSSDDGVNAFSFYGIGHYRLNFPPWTLQAAYWALGISFVAVLGMHWARYRRSGAKPSGPALAAFFSLYAWYLPALVNPLFAYFIPFFHSLQYLAFVWTLKQNQEQSKNDSGWLTRVFGFLATAGLLGALAFEYVPKNLDTFGGFSPLLGSSPVLAVTLLFINIHHYFIDNVIWRATNPDVKQFLFTPARPTVEKSHKRAA